MIRARTLGAIERAATVFVALAIQIVAVAMVGDAFVAGPRIEAALAPAGEPVARVAARARGERLMAVDPEIEVVRVSAPAPMADFLPEVAADLALAPSAEAAPEPFAAPDAAPVADPTPKPKPVATPAPPPPHPPPAITSSSATQQAELRMLALMNASRLQGGLAPLALDVAVSDVARRHSAVEAQYRYVYHDGPDGTAASRYVPACGTGWYGENTGKVWGGGVDVLHREFMAEPWIPINHRTNIMDPNFRRAGIGAVQGPDALYITVAFCR